MLKVTGALLIALAFIISGEKIAKIRRERLDFLEAMLLSLSEFKAAVELFSVPVEKALEKSGIRETERRYIKEFFPGEEDKKDFNVFMKGLRAETLEGQLSNASAYERKLQKEETEERERYKKEAKLIKGGFTLMGILLVVMLL